MVVLWLGLEDLFFLNLRQWNSSGYKTILVFGMVHVFSSIPWCHGRWNWNPRNLIISECHQKAELVSMLLVPKLLSLWNIHRCIDERNRSLQASLPMSLAWNSKNLQFLLKDHIHRLFDSQESIHIRYSFRNPLSVFCFKEKDSYSSPYKPLFAWILPLSHFFFWMKKCCDFNSCVKDKSSQNRDTSEHDQVLL